MTQNATLTDLTNGAHSITFYAADLAGNNQFHKRFNFSVTKPKPEPFPTTTAIAILTVTWTTVLISSCALCKASKKLK